MSKWYIYSKNAQPGDAPKYTVSDIEYHDIWMGEEYVSVTIVSPKTPNKTETDAFSLEIGDYIQYRGRIYSIYNVPSAIKQARVKSYGEAFKYENVKFSSRAMELTEIRFLDIVLGDNQLHYTSLPTFSAYCETVDDLVDRLQANTDRIKDDYDYWFFITPSKKRTLQRIIKWDPTANNNKGEWVPDTERQAVAELLWNEYFSVDADIANEKKNVNIQVDKVSVWGGLSYVKQHFGLNFITNVNSYGRNVIIGASAKHTENTFRYGKNNGLHQIERVADADQLVVTKLYAYGSDKNLPYHYYNDINIRPYLKVTGSYSSAPVGISVLLENIIAYDGGAFTNMILDDGSKRWYTFTCKITNGSSSVICDGNAEMVRITSSQDCTVRLYLATTGSTAGMKFTPQDKIDAVKDIFNNTNPITGIDVIFLSDTDISKFPPNRHTALTDGMPDNMSVNCLMLPGFPVYALNDIVKCEYIEVENEQLVDETRFYVRNTPDDSYSQIPSFIIPGYHVFVFSEDRLRPWIKSPNGVELGIKEGDVHFTEESDDNGLQDVHPSIEGMTENDVFHNGSTARLDEIYDADVIQDNGIFSESDTRPNFHVVLKDLGFDLRQAFANAGSSMKLCMRDGYCGGRNFNVKTVARNIEGRWDLTVERLPDESLELYFPYSDAAAHDKTPIANEPYQIRTGDHFVLTDILIQDTNYIHAASVELFRKSCIWLAANDYTRFTYLPKIDEIFMARDKDTAYRVEYDTIKAGKAMDFEDNDLQISGSLYIDQLTIKENGNHDIPTFDVTLREDKQVGKLDRMQNQINSLTFAAGDSGGAALRYLKSIWDFDANGNLFTKYNVYSLLGVSALGKNTSGGGGGGATSLDDLVNVKIASPTDGQVLKYNALTHKWVNAQDTGMTINAMWDALATQYPPQVQKIIDLTHIPVLSSDKIPSLDASKITSGEFGVNRIPNLDAAKVTTGIFSVSQIPDITISKITDFPSKWAWSDIDNKPTTLSGYGITDVAIADGVITLGTGNTITPVTSVAMTVPTGFVVTGSPITKTGTLALAYSAGYEGFTTTLKNKIDLLYSLFTREGSGTSADPYIIKANYGLYTEQFLSALGLNSQQGSSGALYSLLDVKPDDPTNPSKVYGAQTGYVLTYGSDGKWYAAQATGSVTSIIVGTTTYSPVNGVITLPAYPQVPSWALQPNKPSYAFSEITGTATPSQIPSLSWNKIATDKPTTISGYGISDLYFGTAGTDYIPLKVGAGNAVNLLTAHQTLYTISLFGGTTKIVDFKPDANASFYIKSSGDISLSADAANNAITLSYSHPTNGANTTITAANGLVLSAITVNDLGHVTSVSSKTLAAVDIPTLEISKINGLQTALDAKLDIVAFERLFNAMASDGTTKINHPYSGAVASIKAMFGLWTEQYLSALGLNSQGGGGGGATSLDDLVNVKIASPTDGQVLKYNATTHQWINANDEGVTSITWSNILNKPTTIGGYGIIDAYINAGTIYIGGASITPLTSFTETDPTVPAWAKEASKPSYAFSEITGTATPSQIPSLDASKITSGTFDSTRIPTASSSVKGGVIVGTGLAIASAVLGLATSGVTAGTYTKMIVDAYGRATYGTTLGTSDIPDLSGTYLPLSAGSTKPLTGDLYVGSNSVLFANTSGLSSLSTQISNSELTIERSGHGVVESEEHVTIESDSIVLYSSVTAFDETTTHTTILLPSGITIDGNAVATQSWVNANFYTMAQADAKYMTIAAFENLFRAMQSDGTTPVAHPYSPNSVASIKAMFGLWTEQYLSALGLNSQGGGGGGASSLSDLTDVQITNVANGQILRYDGTHWINVTPNYATTTQLANYLPLSGGTLSGSLTIGTALGIGTAPTSGYALDADGVIRATGMYIGSNVVATQSWVGNQGYIKPSISDPLADGDVLVYDSGAWYNTHRATYLSGYATTSELGNYLPLSGGTLTGDIYFPADSGIVLDTYSYIHVSDSDSYLHIGGYDAMVFEVNHTERMRITSNGRVGIGKYPSFALDVNGTIHGSIAQVGNGYVNQGKEFGFIDGGFRIYQYEDFDEDDPHIWLYLHDNGKFDANDFGTIFLNNAPIVVNCDVEFCDAEQSSFVGKSIKAGNIYMNSSLVATQYWVGNQGYITSSGSCSYAASAGSASHASSANFASDANILGHAVQNNSSHALADGDILVYDTGVWNNFSILDYATKTWVGNNYLPLTGGTLTSANSILTLRSSTQDSWLYFQNTVSGTVANKASVGYYADFAFIANENTYARIGVTNAGVPQYWNNSSGGSGHVFDLIHSGNIGSYNSGSATKLQTARTIWGQSFDGSGNVDGDLYLGVGIGIILDVDSSIVVDDTDSNLHINGYNATRFKINGTEYMTLLQGGNVGIGTTSPQYKLEVLGQTMIYQQVGIGTAPTTNYSLDVDGTARATSFVNSSDIRRKDVLNYDAEPQFYAVANAPAIRFKWKERSSMSKDMVCIGSVAQYWQSILPEAVIEDTYGYLSMQYDVIALLSAISVAKRVTEHERRIEQLERENALLRMEINELKAA